MAVQSKTTIKSYFETGDRPTQAQFIDLIDSYIDASAPVVTVADNAFTIFDNATPTKQAQFELASITAGTTRTYTLPDVSSVVAVLSAAQTFSQLQTFTVGPVFTDASAARSNLGLGTAATRNTSTSGANVPLMSTSNDWGGTQTFTSAAFSGSPNFVGNPTGKIASGTYTPSLTNSANCATLTASPMQWLRVGDVVTVAGVVTIAQTASSAASTFLMTIPLASNFGSSEDCGGCAIGANSRNNWRAIGASAQDQVRFDTSDVAGTSTNLLAVTFTYRVI